MLAAYGQTAHFLNEAPFNGGASLFGSLTFTSSVPVAVVAIRGFRGHNLDRYPNGAQWWHHHSVERPDRPVPERNTRFRFVAGAVSGGPKGLNCFIRRDFHGWTAGAL